MKLIDTFVDCYSISLVIEEIQINTLKNIPSTQYQNNTEDTSEAKNRSYVAIGTP